MEKKKQGLQYRDLTEVMGIVHTGIHTLSSFRRMGMTSIPSDENAFVGGKLGCDSLTNCALRLEKTHFKWGVKY
jgi:hypothetical protein